jgi:hypothetical protein
MAACRWPNVPFPLTPGLSLGERENRATLQNDAIALREGGRPPAPNDAGGLFPLPEGEG